MEAHKKETAATRQTEIRNDQAMLGEAQTKLATATTKEANAGEQARQTAAHSSQLLNDMIYESMSNYDAEFSSA